ncbi:BZ3500_MvSof-1268-A1-R1_Chr1-3g02141 [Microbotryum saponariae]|uniref:tRNA (guanine(9)-N1)-methyltransferase n=1 Tax=Microbotryum saponariae TaxID=289078 RepID=A0A2X0MSM1_9BASI|nr:BZ3500_MvSof-1268-A1-R1_Chr1-3g02141 [Microbotryum saponariae]SCZ95494.1 BZ3501_MvSof-1269-A2-R1_Chr1-3g01744 [Microbotryum saponariae]
MSSEDFSAPLAPTTAAPDSASQPTPSEVAIAGPSVPSNEHNPTHPPQPSTSASSVPIVDENGRTLSKNALKKLKKAAAREATKAFRRQQERASRKAKQARKRQLVAEGVLDKEELESVASRKRRRLREAGGRVVPHGAKVIIDLGFDELMTENVSHVQSGWHRMGQRVQVIDSRSQEVKSMSSQLGFCYSANRNALKPFDLIMTSLSGRLKQRLDSTKGTPHEHWKGVRWMTDSYTALYDPSTATAPSTTSSTTASTEASTSTLSPTATTTATPTESEAAAQAGPTPVEADPLPALDKSSFIYLTGDSTNVLTTIDPTKTYILGGIVDRNRYKSLCLDKALQHGIGHAQLPIGEYLAEMPTRKVLTVNQVYDIMVQFVECGDWEKALRDVMPLRKMTHGTPGHKKTGERKVKIKEAEARAEGVYVAKDEMADEDDGVDGAQDDEDDDDDASDAVPSDEGEEGMSGISEAGNDDVEPSVATCHSLHCHI